MKLDDLQNGDLIFVVSMTEIGLAIQEATGNYSHVALFLGGLIYHAVGDRGVIKEPLENFIQEEQEYEVFFYPLMNVEELRERAEQLLGLPYNVSFYPEAEGFYCSEYIAEILPIFEKIPMKFGSQTHLITPFWQAYYEELNLPVPLNVLGTNPSQLAQSPRLIYKGRLDDTNF